MNPNHPTINIVNNEDLVKLIRKKPYRGIQVLVCKELGLSAGRISTLIREGNVVVLNLVFKHMTRVLEEQRSQRSALNLKIFDEELLKSAN